jgi:hypothetical protein
MKKFRTNARLWLSLAAVLFVIAWFLPLQGTNDGQMPPAMFFIVLARALFSAEIGTSVSLVGILAFWTIVIATASLLVAWLVQGFVQIIRIG